MKWKVCQKFAQRKTQKTRSKKNENCQQTKTCRENLTGLAHPQQNYIFIIPNRNYCQRYVMNFQNSPQFIHSQTSQPNQLFAHSYCISNTSEHHYILTVIMAKNSIMPFSKIYANFTQSKYNFKFKKADSTKNLLIIHQKCTIMTRKNYNFYYKWTILGHRNRKYLVETYQNNNKILDTLTKKNLRYLILNNILNRILSYNEQKKTLISKLRKN